jgi:hypothetical protein
MQRFLHSIWLKASLAAILSLVVLNIFTGCRAYSPRPKTVIHFVRVPRGGHGGAEIIEPISGSVTGFVSGQQVVLYAKNGPWWWVQPFRSRPLTKVETDSTWNTVTHIGAEYAALLVVPGHQPQAKIGALPPVGNEVLAVATVKGVEVLPVVSKIIRFSGYDWIVRASPSDRGGEMNHYDPANAWVDQDGHLHLKMGERDGHWTCAGLNLSRSLGYGTYRFVVQDSAHLEPSAVLAMFTLDERGDQETRTELDIELSRWGNPGKQNGDYTVQPYYVPENTAHFSIPPGRFTHVLRWEPGVASFRTFSGKTGAPGVRDLAHHVFTSGIPVPGGETAHIDFYDFFHSRSGLTQSSEVVIEKFEYLP